MVEVFGTKEAKIDQTRKMRSADFRRGLLEKNRDLVFIKDEFDAIRAVWKPGMSLSDAVYKLEEIGCSQFVIGYITGQVTEREQSLEEEKNE